MLPLLAALATLALIPALSVLYREFLDGRGPASSAALTVMVSGCSAVVWLAASSLVPGVAGSRTQLPVAALAAVAGFLVTLPVRTATPRTTPSVLLAGVWTLTVFVPVAVVTFSPAAVGIGVTDQVVDLGGALPVHVAIAGGTLVVLLLGHQFAIVDRSHTRPTRTLLVAASALLWAAWTSSLVAFEFEVGAASVDIVVSSLAASVSGLVGWLIVERIRFARTTLQGAMAGQLCGLVAITAGAGTLNLLWSIVTGIAVGLGAALFTFARISRSGRASWFLVAAHGIAGVTGIVLLGLFAQDFGFIFLGQAGLVATQLAGALGALLWSGAVTLALWPFARWLAARRGRVGA